MRKKNFEELLESIHEVGLIMRSQNATTNKREHITNGSGCWCWPEIEILGDGMKMFTHRDMNATKTGTEQ